MMRGGGGDLVMYPDIKGDVRLFVYLENKGVICWSSIQKSTGVNLVMHPEIKRGCKVGRLF